PSASAPSWAGGRGTTTSTPSCAPRLPGSSACCPIRGSELSADCVECVIMQWGRPKSLSGLMLVGLALIAVPLLVALLTAVLQIRNLADTGTKIVIQGVAGARASQKLFGEIASLERMARQYDVLGNRK